MNLLEQAAAPESYFVCNGTAFWFTEGDREGCVSWFSTPASTDGSIDWTRAEEIEDMGVLLEHRPLFTAWKTLHAEAVRL